MGSPIFGYLAAFFAFLFYVGIIRSILLKTIVPSRMTWIIWGVNDLLLLVSSYLVGAWNTLWVPLVYVVCGLFCAAASIKNDAKPLTMLDKACLVLSVLAWVILMQTKDYARISLILGVLVNTIGGVPTWVKLWREPATERALTWLLVLIAGALQLFAVEEWRFDLLLFPINTLVTSALTVGLILRRKV